MVGLLVCWIAGLLGVVLSFCFVCFVCFVLFLKNENLLLDCWFVGCGVKFFGFGTKQQQNKALNKTREELFLMEHQQIREVSLIGSSSFATDRFCSKLRVIQKASGLVFGVGFLVLHFGNATVAITSQNGYEEVLQVLRSYFYQIHPFVGNNTFLKQLSMSACFGILCSQTNRRYNREWEFDNSRYKQRCIGDLAITRSINFRKQQGRAKWKLSHTVERSSVVRLPSNSSCFRALLW